jgi:hypothetical protein
MMISLIAEVRIQVLPPALSQGGASPGEDGLGKDRRSAGLGREGIGLLADAG